MSFLMTDRQFEFWRLRRDGIANIRIAEQFHISRQAVSKALLTMEGKVEKTLLEMAHANQIEVQRYNVKKGVLFGRSVPFNAATHLILATLVGLSIVIWVVYFTVFVWERRRHKVVIAERRSMYAIDVE
ncbi:hypothetical protein [Methanogenium sp. MK-MG]|uniref:hypothetical protein n=1 Tax=Methanogenium sp. MK-MG TaxID=2599926 RepID=UPI0020B11A0D|nr:hypothetical protein [Methanogenium sp. MK-MG]KAF1073211.1 hypothetical protein MKMG_02240 [Methanogenium sp. MK-MG]